MMQEPLQQIPEPLLKWFTANKRALPWRQDKNPYHVWVSEIMLQQTRIEAVKKYYARFMEKLPDLKSLSEVSEDELLKLWEGLGYYSRARNLRKAAVMIMQEYGGQFPETYAEIRKLPGIGDYTAGAIASICFQEKVTAVDGNVLRVVARITGSRQNVLLPETKKQATAQLTAILPEQSGLFNEGLMELGELICLPNGTPLCESCPLQKHCTAFRENLTAELPVRIKQLKRRKEERSVFLMTDPQGRIAIEKRPARGLLSGMYQLPNIKGFFTDEQLRELLNDWQTEVTSLCFIKDAKHVFTHIDWYMKGYRVSITQPTDRFLWVSPEELSRTYALPTAFKPFLTP